MKKLRMIFLLAGMVACSLMSLSFNAKADREDFISVGEKAPVLILGGDTVHGSPYTLVSFWSTADAKSRAGNALMSNKFSLADSIAFVSVSFDRLESVFRGSVRSDGLDEEKCYVDTAGPASRLYKAYCIDRGYKSCLIDSAGTIVEVYPMTEKGGK